MRLVAAVALAAALLAPAPPDHVTVHLIGDSTMADKPSPEVNPERGWGQALPSLFDDRVTVRNHAVNGRSTRSFIAEHRWQAVLDSLEPGDYVFIQFGHNDEKVEDSTRFTNPYTGYRRNLERFVVETRAKGARPVLFTPIVRRHFNEHGVLEDTHGAYPLVVRLVARDLAVPLVDLQLMTEDLVLGAGPEGSKSLYVWTTEGQFPAFPAAKQDDTHLSPAGAAAVARLAARGLRDGKVPLASHLRIAR